MSRELNDTKIVDIFHCRFSIDGLCDCLSKQIAIRTFYILFYIQFAKTLHNSTRIVSITFQSQGEVSLVLLLRMEFGVLNLFRSYFSVLMIIVSLANARKGTLNASESDVW